MNYLRIFSTEADFEEESPKMTYPYVAYIEKTKRYVFETDQRDYSNDYLTFNMLSDGTISLIIESGVTTSMLTSVSYSLDGGQTWTTTNNVNSTQVVARTPTVSAGNKVLWKGTATQYADATRYISCFSVTGDYELCGNIMSLLYGDNFANDFTFSGRYNFLRLFKGSSKLIAANNLVLPARTLTERCYEDMFNGCNLLMVAPALPATTLAQSCYDQMFYGCTSLTTVPELPATTLANYCYQNMFSYCTSLTTVPELPATTLAQYCYQYMFYGCTGLTTAPVLPATTLAQYCYCQMFYGCTSLTTAPELPAVTLAQSCYAYMFSYCTSLTTAPDLPALALVTDCYKNMFQNCSSLNYIKAMFTTTPSATYTAGWVTNVALSGTFVKNSAATWTTTGNNGIPDGWTVETDTPDEN